MKDDYSLLDIDKQAAKILKRKFHFCVNIEGALRNKAFSMFTEYNGHNKKLIEKKLRYELAMGRKVLPVGDICEGFSYIDGCPGHIAEEKV